MVDLTAHKKNIFLIEMAAWLHNLPKLSPEFVKARSAPEQWWKSAKGYVDSSLLIEVEKSIFDSLPPPFEVRPPGSTPLIDLLKNFLSPTTSLEGLLNIAHQEASGEEKRSQQREAADTRGEELHDPTLLGGQIKDAYPWWSVGPLGDVVRIYPDPDSVEKRKGEASQEALKQLQAIQSGSEPDFKHLRELLVKGIADSQLPICDVRIADMGLMVAAFAKAAFVESLISKQWLGGKQQWRLLRVAVDGIGYISTPSRIPEVLARQTRLLDELKKQTKAVEREWLYGTRVYQDEYGPVFVIPDLEAPWLTTAIEANWQIPDAPIDLQLSDPFGLGSGRGYAFQLGKLLARSCRPPIPRPSLIATEWSSLKSGHQTEPCGACQIRPVGPSQSEQERRLCRDCYQTRVHRVEKWKTDHSDSTIWLEEACDENGRVALIAARFRVGQWLIHGEDGPGYLETSVFHQKPYGRTPFNVSPSAARSRRLFESLQEFWDQARALWMAPTDNKRIALKPDSNPWEENNAYELVSSSNARISAVWTGREFVITENLERLQKNAPSDKMPNWKGDFDVRLPSGYRRDQKPRANSNRGSFTGAAVGKWGEPYHPIIDILKDPRQYYALLPAASAFSCVEKTIDLYKQRYGRVRNRLGLDITMVAAQVDTPLRALLDAARRGMQRQTDPECWTVDHVDIPEARDTPARIYQPRQCQVRFENGVFWTIPLAFEFAIGPEDKNGNQTESFHRAPDHFYPYFRTRAGMTVHAADLQPGDQVDIEPSTFDYEFLDSSARRFELSYDDRGRRRSPDLSHRPILIENVLEIQQLWDLLSTRLATRQLKFLDGLLAAKREEWSTVPESFIRNVIANLELRPHFTPREVQRIIRAATTGLLHDCLELHLGLEKSAEAPALRKTK